MYLHIGGDIIVPFRDVIGVFDIVTSDSPATRDFLQTAREEGFVMLGSESTQVKSYVLTSNKVYMSPIACATLRKRWTTLAFGSDDT